MGSSSQVRIVVDLINDEEVVQLMPSHAESPQDHCVR